MVMQCHRTLSAVCPWRGKLACCCRLGFSSIPGAEAFAILRDILFPLLAMLTHKIGVEKLAADLDRMGRAVGEDELETDQIVLSCHVENREFVQARFRGRSGPGQIPSPVLRSLPGQGQQLVSGLPGAGFRYDGP